MTIYWGLFLAFWPVFLALLLFGLGGIGIWLDKEHAKNLAYRRAELGHVLVTNSRQFPGFNAAGDARVELVVSEVVLSANRLITAIGRIKLIFGGEVKSFHNLITRARQEALIRLMEQVAAKGFDSIGNLRLEGVDVAGTAAGGKRKQKGVYVGLIAYGTAYNRRDGFFPPPAAPTLEAYPT